MMVMCQAGDGQVMVRLQGGGVGGRAVGGGGEPEGGRESTEAPGPGHGEVSWQSAASTVTSRQPGHSRHPPGTFPPWMFSAFTEF